MSSSACGRVSCIIIPPLQTTKRVSSVAKMQTPASHAGYAFGLVKQTYVTACCPVTGACQTYGRNIWFWARNACGSRGAVEEEGRGLHGGSTGTGPPWSTPCSHGGKERVKEHFKADAFWYLECGFYGRHPFAVLCLWFINRARINAYGFTEAFIFKTALEVPDVILVWRPLLIFTVLWTCSVIVVDILAAVYCAHIWGFLSSCCCCSGAWNCEEWHS